MRETLPDVAMDERAPALFLTGFGVLLAVLLALLVLALALKARARTAGIRRKYALRGDETARRRVSRPT